MPAFTSSVRSSSSAGITTRPRLPVANVSINLPRMPHGNVRQRGRERWQARIYVGGRAGGAIHLGMYGSETAAAQICRRVLRALLGESLAAAEREEAGGAKAAKVIGPMEVWKAARKLSDNGFDVDGQLASLLPRCVCPDGRGKYGIRIRGGNGCDRGGYETPEAAFQAVLKARERARMLAEKEGVEIERELVIA